MPRPGLSGPAALLLALLAAPPASAQSPPEDLSTAQAAQLASLLGFVDSALADNRLSAAQDLLARARGLDTGPEVQLREAELLLASGVFPQAIALFDNLEADPGTAARAGVGRAIALLRLGRSVEADTALVQALALDPGLLRGWLARAALADQRGDWPAAEAAHARALAIDPLSATALNNRGYSRLLQGRPAEAEADLARASKLDPRLAAARTNLRLAVAMQGRYAEAFAGSTKADLARDLNTVGFAAMARGDLALAESYFSRALELNTRYDRTAAANLAYLRALQPIAVKEPKPPK